MNVNLAQDFNAFYATGLFLNPSPPPYPLSRGY